MRIFVAGKMRAMKAVALLAAALAVMLSGCESSPDEKEITLLKEDAKVYTNSFKLDQEWEDYGIGDPFIMRYNGRFYLYCSTKDFRPGIKAWSSDNLVDWSYEGLVTEDPITTGAYAPEVFYWNGSFYLYTSPAGQGHYVLQSDSPTGPFVVKTENLGNSIDGSVFIDDDGKWYFTNAGTQGIVAHEMPDPFTIDIGVTTNAFLGHWTEGSMIWKRNGLYYMTYTGNHVFSNGYRVNYAVSKDGPFGDYALPANNPIVISVKDDFKGLGHSATVLGPDMDSYYLTYHNLVGHSAEGPPVRELNIDRLAYNGDKLVVFGPTHDHKQPAPAMPALYGWLSDGIAAEQWEKTESAKGETVLSKLATEATFIAEYNFRLGGADAAADNGMVEAVFSYTDASNYSAVILLPSKHELHYITVKNGTEQHGGYAALPSDFDYSKLHTIRVERRDNRVLVFFDGMKKLEEETAGPGEGKIGYVATNAKPVYEYTAFTNDAGGSSDFEIYKPVPGTVEAVHYLKEAERGFHIEQKPSEISAYRAADGVPIQKLDDGSYSVTLQQRGDWLKYKLNAKADAKYGIGLTLRKPEKDSVLEWSIDGGDPVKTKINADDPAFTEDTAKLRIGTLDISAGFHEMKIELKSGAAVIQSLELFTAEQLEEQQTFEQLPVQSGFGLFGQNDHAYTGSGTEDDRLFAGSDAWDDYTFSVGVKLNADTDIGGLFIRETNESYHPAQVRDAAMGYYIGISSSQLTLHRLNYDSVLVASETVELETGRVYTLKAEAKGGTIQVFLNDEPKPLIHYTDPHPFLYGKVGIHAERSTLSFYDLIVKPIKK
ncbi:family 43 glycosylhydrolase [Paenibacillus sp. LHD-38]|uniref:family 43 glycosylhydrolase n=1 Tax=Paenibacillus sp. LHD-38 TaxID=3072143 RepID=UPI00280F1949|nr:family 43 glycosylhydrolase [Paenibacillus sp. LHD-38]MDQ8734811.1 family 43 glycosylhydrolase [Paenibacillus sp. LHD-38]